MEKINFAAFVLLGIMALAFSQNLTCFAPAAYIELPNAKVHMDAVYALDPSAAYFDGNYYYIKNMGKTFASISQKENFVVIEFASSDTNEIGKSMTLLAQMGIVEKDNSTIQILLSADNSNCRNSGSLAAQREVAITNGGGAAGAESAANAQAPASAQSGINLPAPSKEALAASSQSNAASEKNKPAAYDLLLPFIAGTAAVFFLSVMAFYFKQRETGMQVEIPQDAYVGQTQMAILGQIEEVERIPTDIASRVGKSKSTVVEHLDSLVKQGLVERISNPEKKFVFYRLSHVGKSLLLRKRHAA